MKKLYALAVAAFAALSASAAAGDWLTVEDFENNPATPGLFNYNGGTPVGTPTIETVAFDGNVDNHAAKFTAGNYETALLITINLPEGKTIANYKAIDFDIYNYTMQYKSIFVYVNGNTVREPNGNDEGKKETWKHYEYALNNISGAGTEVQIAIGFRIHSTDAFAVDNIRLQESGEGGSGEDPDPQPEGFYETANGTVTDGVLMVNDLQQHNAVDVTLSAWARKDDSGNQGAPVGTAKTAVDPKDAKNLTAHFKGGDYNTVLEFDVTLPEGKTLADYSTVLFDLYRNNGDAENKKFRVQADDEVIHYDEGWPSQGNKNQWQNRSYNIPEDTQVGNSFKLRLGIESNEADYLIDNIRLVERPAAEIELVGEPQITITHAKKAGVITVDYSFTVANYNNEEVNVAASVVGKDVTFVDSTPANAPARAASENKVFSGSLRAEHESLIDLADTQVKLTATAGEKQLFDITRAPHTTTGIEDAAVDSAAAAEYYNLNGMRVDTAQLAPGIYIRKTGDKAEKVLVK